MLQEIETIRPVEEDDACVPLTSQSLAALLAIAGSKKLTVDDLKARSKLTAGGFGSVLSWLQREYLVDVVSTLRGDAVMETVLLTERGERSLLKLLEQMCELPELR